MTRFCRALVALSMLHAFTRPASAAEPLLVHSFAKHRLSEQFTSEGATIADVDGDGAPDVVAGPYWHRGPTFAGRIEYRPAQTFNIDNYSDVFFNFAHDFNGDGRVDVFTIGLPGNEAFWFENPQGKPGHWVRHLAFDKVDNESPVLADVTGDGRPELVCNHSGALGYAEPSRERPERPWRFRAISPNRGYQMYTHGLGVGDVNGDGRNDVLEKDGWWEQPAVDDGKPWTLHEVRFSEPGGAQMFAYDVDGDGDNDVITSKAAHAYGLAWFEQHRDGETVSFREHKITGETPQENEYGVAFSQLHALALVDMDRDGVCDIVTGKRWWAHSAHDPGSLEPAVLYWFKTVRDAGAVKFVPYLIDDDSGVGTQVTVGDLDGDEWPDIVVGNKKGTFAFLHHAEESDRAAWEKAQPVARGGDARPQAVVAPGEYLATDAAGRALNLDFETGDLRDWTAQGDAFAGQPIQGDTVHPRRSDSTSGHKGDYWIGTYERAGDAPRGTLTSTSFVVTRPWASFRVGGGSSGATRVEIVRRDTGNVIFKSAGYSYEEMRPAAIDLRELVGKEIFLRIVDDSGDGWGHINFDHFRFHDEQPPTDLLKPRVFKADEYPHAGLSADEAARAMKLPDGFRATAFASEPDVKQPIAMALDDRGRVWVAEAYEYPVRAPEGEGRDRILIFEDVDGDGRFDKRTVFAEGLNLVSGLEVGFGGAWVGAAPYLLFIPDRNGDDVPDGEPEVLLDGWAYQDTHETLNAFTWGPDGWLYGCHGVFTHSNVGKPGAPDDERVRLNAAIWRYHPTRRAFELFAEGTSNPWGVDFDDRGQTFCTACVIPHLFHIIQGARYNRQAGSHFNPHTYADIQTIADHRHYVGDNPHAGNGNSDSAGGGHAHAGAMIYLADAWPEEYRGRIFMNNIHGQRVNVDVLTPRGSGFVGGHADDFLLTGDLASQMLYFAYGPDGNVFVIDWYDMNACHHNNVEGHDRSNGRIYKIVHGAAKPTTVNIAQLSDVQLADLTTHANDWYVRHARRRLQERAAAGQLDPRARESLAKLAAGVDEAKIPQRLRAMWALHVTGGLPNEMIDRLLDDADENVRGWTIRLALDREQALAGDSAGLVKRLRLEPMAAADPSPVVRLFLASALQQLPLANRWGALEALLKHAEDARDHNLPLMYWYAAEPLAEADAPRAASLALSCAATMPQVRDFMLRRVAAIGSPEALAVLVDRLTHVEDAEQQLAILRAMRRGLEGRRTVAPPANWTAAAGQLLASPNADAATQAVALGVKFGDPGALDWLRRRAVEKDAPLALRRDAIESLLAAKDPQLAAMLLSLLDDPGVRDLAITGLANYEDAATPAKLIALYPELSPEERRAALATLCSRVSFGVELLNAIAAKRIATADLPADLARQLQHLKSEELDRLLADTWGQVRTTPEDKARLIAEYRELASQPPVAPDAELGRAVFARTCQQCHTLYGAGGDVGPDLTGSNRSDLEYLLPNIVDPSAVIAKEYFTTIVLTVDGRGASGVLGEEDDKSLTLKTATETLVIPHEDIEERQLSDVSMMPENQLAQFTPAEIVSLLAYLRSAGQTPLLARQDNQGLLFNGRDLAGWSGQMEYWSVENGEIIGRSPGLENNSFLVSDLSAEDFRLSLEVKLVDNVGNSGIQFRSRPFQHGEMQGYQADVGADWWGKLYEENGRALLWDKPGDQHARTGDWNVYVIEAREGRVRTWLNGTLCVDLEDAEGARRGVFALQLHSGGPMEVRYRNLQLEVLAPGTP